MTDGAARSIGELRFYLERAATGAGLDPGAGEDFVAAALHAAARGLDPTPACAAALEGLLEARDPYGIEIVEDGGEVVFRPRSTGPLCALTLAPQLRDRLEVDLATGRERARYRVRRLDAPGMLLATLHEWLERRGSAGLDARVSGVSASILLPQQPRRALRQLPAAPVDLALTPRRGATRRRETPPAAPRVETDADAWRIIEAFFRRSLAPSSERSRAGGAGAGLVEDD